MQSQRRKLFHGGWAGDRGQTQVRGQLIVQRELWSHLLGSEDRLYPLVWLPMSWHETSLALPWAGAAKGLSAPIPGLPLPSGRPGVQLTTFWNRPGGKAGVGAPWGWPRSLPNPPLETLQGGAPASTPGQSRPRIKLRTGHGLGADRRGRNEALIFRGAGVTSTRAPRLAGPACRGSHAWSQFQ